MDKLYTLMRLLAAQQITNQRELAKQSGYSLGMVNTLIKTMQERNLVIIQQCDAKTRYVLSEKGVKFLHNMIKEHQLNKQSILGRSKGFIKKAVILAAGKKNEFPGIPVDLLPIADEVCALKRAVDLLHEQDINDITIVIGYRKELYLELFNMPGITFVENERYLWSGSMQSLACASPFIQEDFILLECDHIFEKRALSELLANDQDTCLLSRGMSNEGDDCMVELDENKNMFRISKDIRQLNHVDCILTGIHKLSYVFYQKMMDYFNDNRNPLLNYEYVIESMARDYQVPVLYLDDLLCWDMNGQEIYEKVCQQYYKKLLKREQEIDLLALKQLFCTLMGIEESAVKDLSYAGGMTNTNYRVTCEADTYILRMPGKCTEDMISRSAEKYNSKIAYLLGINVDTVYFDEARGIKITRYVEGAETLTPRMARLEENMKQSALLLRKLHTSQVQLSSSFDVFAEYEKYEALIEEANGTYYSGFTEVREEFYRFRNLLTQIGLEHKACHNDLVAENFIKNEQRMYLIDWEYAGMNDPMWDIAAHLLECKFEPNEQELYLQYYFQSDPCTIAHRQKLLIFMICQDVLWSAWTIAKELKGEDFGTYGVERFHRAQQNIKEYIRRYESGSTDGSK